jgi:hypothetical protein
MEVVMLAGAWTHPRGATLVALLLGLSVAPAAAQSAEACLSQEIASKSKAIKLDEKRAKKAQISGKKFDFVPADLGMVRALDQLKAGVVVGALDTEASVAEGVSLPPGKYEIYVAQVGGQWQAYATKSGKIVKAAKSVVERPDTPANMEPTFNTGSGCWWLWLIITGLNVCW